MADIKAGFVGLGAMGWAMTGHLKRLGLLVGVANRSAAKAQAFAREYGVLGAADPGELAKHCNVIALCVSADADVLEVTRAIAAQALPIMQMTRREVWPCLAAPERVCGAATVRLIPIVPAG